MISCYISHEELSRFRSNDAEIDELLQELNQRQQVCTYYVSQSVRLRKRRFRKDLRINTYELYVERTNGEVQVINFAQESEYTIHTSVAKSYIKTYLLGILTGMNVRERQYKHENVSV
jgi:hypothetical protein